MSAGWDVDYYIGGVLKWLCGGPGGVFMYVRPDLLPIAQSKSDRLVRQRVAFLL